jgi:hypothetical protein
MVSYRLFARTSGRLAQAKTRRQSSRSADLALNQHNRVRSETRDHSEFEQTSFTTLRADLALRQSEGSVPIIVTRFTPRLGSGLRGARLL